MISCLCVTRADRLAFLVTAVGDFARQVLTNRELVIVHDGDAAAEAAILAVASVHPGACVRVVQVVPGPLLGGLRNAAVQAARGDWVCQWDDDDRYHPLRLSLQWDAAQAEGAAACYLVDQLHWSRAESGAESGAEGLLCWDDWDREAYPLNVVQGTLLARRAVMPAYPNVARGEDTLHTHALMRASVQLGFEVARLRGAGWCYVYCHHGANVWDAAHHQAISTAKHLPAARLLPRLAVLRVRLRDYEPELPTMFIQVGAKLETLVSAPDRTLTEAP